MNQHAILLHLINLLYEGGWIKEWEKEGWNKKLQEVAESGEQGTIYKNSIRKEGINH